MTTPKPVDEEYIKKLHERIKQLEQEVRPQVTSACRQLEHVREHLLAAQHLLKDNYIDSSIDVGMVGVKVKEALMWLEHYLEKR